jgi:LDH2 family malate/lactate/ureidoglycolate dehydrogenase
MARPKDGGCNPTAKIEIAHETVATALIGWVGVRRANHVPPFGGSELLLGTNPIAISAPSANTDPFVMNMTTTVAAMGKNKTLIQHGKPMPEGQMVGRDSAPMTGPNKKYKGLLLPIRRAKRFGLRLPSV